MFFIAYIVPQKSNSALKYKNSSRLLWEWLRSFEEVHFQKPEVTNKKTGQTHVKGNWKGFIGLIPLDLYLALWYFRPIHDVYFEINIT